ncbi:hypothetical protein [Nocardioides nitrophenolicus]|uniref:hypothetical protein n=1 Tax=Nocardioides nitrophenolicus TaxID=60489 RepID=UPI00195AE903|nr:hypothetical protein [Nocardioides nitrophenolicus]MBM7518393.1 hypothetical protein [Nocardioides nitrophenolicus]
MRPPLRLLLPLVLALVAGVLGLPGAGPSPAAAAPSNAGTIVYLKGYDIYVARPDGTGERRLTTDGTLNNPWRSPSSADDGTVVAGRGPLVVRMDQWGTVLNSFDPPDLWDSAGETIGGTIQHVQVSPDGSRVAYTFEHHSCPPRGACRLRWTTAISASTALTSALPYGFAFFPDPSWVTGSRLVTGGNTDDLHMFDPGVSENLWFNDAQPNVSDQHDLFEPAISRDGSMMATVRGVGPEQHMGIWQLNGNILTGPIRAGVPAIWPTLICKWIEASFSSPTFAPDSSSLAWAEGDGIWVLEDPLGCDIPPSLVVPGGYAPHWSAAALQSVRPTYPTPPGGGAGSGFALTAAPTVKAKGTARVGTRLRATAGTWRPAPSAVRYQWLRDGKAITKATKASYRIKKVDRKHRISVRVTVSRAGYADAVATSRKVKVRR